jgi:hypothetical protein
MYVCLDVQLEMWLAPNGNKGDHETRKPNRKANS